MTLDWHSPDAVASRIMAHADYQDRLAAAIAELPQEFRQAVQLRYRDRQSTGQVAITMGLKGEDEAALRQRGESLLNEAFTRLFEQLHPDSAAKVAADKTSDESEDGPESSKTDGG